MLLDLLQSHHVGQSGTFAHKRHVGPGIVGRVPAVNKVLFGLVAPVSITTLEVFD